MAPTSPTALPTPPLRSEPAITGAQSRPLASLRILVVDHDATFCQRYCDDLIHAGHRVDTAADD